MATFVLVHGAWHGGWCWRRVARRLRDAGHDVYTPTLTGLGERRHLVSPMVGVNLHVEDVVNVLLYEDLQDVVLCGHSYGGMIITGVAGRVPERLRCLVYLDAFVPRDGQCGLDLRTPEGNRALLEQVQTSGAGWRMTPLAAGAVFRVRDPRDRQWVDAQMTEMPYRAYTERLRVEREWPGPKVYVRAEDYPFPPFDAVYEATLADPAWQVHRLPGGHVLMVDNPEDVSGILLALA